MTTYQQLFDRAPTFPMFPVHGSPQEQEAFSIKCANSILRMRATAKACIDNKMYTKKITGLVQEFVPKVSGCQPQQLTVQVQGYLWKVLQKTPSISRNVKYARINLVV